MALRWLRRFRTGEIVCRDAVELVTAYLEGQLSAREQARFEAHLAACPHCTAYVEQMRTTIRAIGGALPEPVDANTRDELVALYRRWQAG